MKSVTRLWHCAKVEDHAGDKTELRYLCIRIHTCIGIHIHIYIYMHMYVYTQVHTNILYVQIYKCMYNM